MSLWGAGILTAASPTPTQRLPAVALTLWRAALCKCYLLMNNECWIPGLPPPHFKTTRCGFRVVGRGLNSLSEKLHIRGGDRESFWQTYTEERELYTMKKYEKYHPGVLWRLGSSGLWFKNFGSFMVSTSSCRTMYQNMSPLYHQWLVVTLNVALTSGQLLELTWQNWYKKKIIQEPVSKWR